jgi:hypothetical protein
VQNRENQGSDGNCESTYPGTTTVEVSSPPTAINWAVGFVGNLVGNGYFESTGTPICIRSLYMHQLEERLGSSAVNAITVSAQRSGRIWTDLQSWAGEGRPSWLP